MPSLVFRANYVEPGVLWKAMRYSIRRSMKDKTIHLVFEETCFDDLPEHVRKKGPWQHLKSGEFENLRADYRQAINEHRYHYCRAIGGRVLRRDLTVDYPSAFG